MSRSFFLSNEGELLAKSAAFSQTINADPTRYGLTPAQASAYAAVHQQYADAYRAAADPTTRTPPAIARKRASKADLMRAASDMSKIISTDPSVTAEMRMDLGLSVRKKRELAKAPTEAPALSATQTGGRTVRVKIMRADSARRAMPEGVGCAYVFTHVGDQTPTDLKLWDFRGQVRGRETELRFSNDIPPGTRVWITAQWVSRLGEVGPAARSVGTTLWNTELSLPVLKAA